MQKSKWLGQVYTPQWIVCEILDGLNYQGAEILKKTILEPSCGQGAFLVEIVARYIDSAEKAGLSHSEIISDLETYIYGIEIDPLIYAECIEKLNQLCLIRLGKPSIDWKIYQQDTLDVFLDYLFFFDYIVGNPPYIRIHNLPNITRHFIKKQFKFTTGTTDLYLVFFEMAFKMLKNTGKLGFISPNSFLYNSSYKAFRATLQSNKSLISLTDFQSDKIFEGFSTYTAISLFNLTNQRDDFDYQELKQGKITRVNKIKFSDLKAEKWILASNENEQFLKSISSETSKCLEEMFNIQYGFATLRDCIFIGKKDKINERYSLFNGYHIENQILNPIVKGSKYRGNAEEIEWVIFPYKKENNRYISYTEQEMQQKFPKAYLYLLDHKTELLARDRDKNSEWFAFGRSQGIQTSHSEKVVVSTLVSDKVHFAYLPEDVFVYSGIFITKREPDTDWSVLDKILKSEEFYKYIRLTGKDLSGGYKSISTKQIKQFKLPVQPENIEPPTQLSLFGECYE